MAFAHQFNLNIPITDYERVRESFFDLNNTPTNYSEDSEDDLANSMDVETEVLSPNVTENLETTQNQQTITKRKEMTDAKRWEVYRALLQRSNNGVLKRETTKEVANLLAVPKQSVQKIWRRAKDNVSNGETVDVSHRRKGKCGRKPKEIDLEQIFNIPLHCRTTMRSIAVALEVSPSTIHRYVKHGLVRRHSNVIKPTLKDDNKKARVKFCLSMLDKNTFPHQPKFVDMFNIIHIDEKWFYMTKKSTTYYLHPLEEDPVRSCQSKNFIGKVMFLAAMARPRFDEEGNEIFSGKIGMFPFVTMQEAQRWSRNREAVTMELKPMDSIKREDIKRCLIEKVLPNIRERWPAEDFGKTIFIQQDNARTHVDVNNEEFQEAASQHGFDIRLMCQPPNSPDMNILDLGFFLAIQSLQHKVCPTTVEQLVHAVEEAYDEYPPKQVNRIFLTLQSCLLETMKIGGANTYKIPHMKKDRLEREGRLPIQLACDPILVQEVISSLAC